MPPGLLAFHLLCVFGWFATTMTGLHITKAHGWAPPEKRGDFKSLQRKLGRGLDMSAAASITTGIALIVIGGGAHMKMGFMHAKFTLVLGILVGHVFLRRSFRLYQNGDIRPQPKWLGPVTALSFFAILFLMTFRPWA